MEKNIRLKPIFSLTPRSCERISTWKTILKQSNIPFELRSELRDNPSGPVLLLDLIGELPALFFMGKAAYIGGGFDSELGGHFLRGTSWASCIKRTYRHSNPQAWRESRASSVINPRIWLKGLRATTQTSQTNS